MPVRVEDIKVAVVSAVRGRAGRIVWLELIPQHVGCYVPMSYRGVNQRDHCPYHPHQGGHV